MKKYSFLTAVLAGLCCSVGCKKQVTPSAFAQAYARFVMLDAPGSADVQFYLDGKINANGDSLIASPDGTNFTPDPSLLTTSLIDYPSGGWTDNTPVTKAGTYGYFYASADSFSIWPNPTNRIPLAPVINGYNYFDWASLPAANHEASFYGVVNATLYGNQVFAKGAEFLDQNVNLEGGAIQTFFTVNEAPCKAYNPSGINTLTGLPIYYVSETINFFSDQFSLISVKDHPAQLPQFHDSSAYVRFMNVTPTYLDQGLNANTANIDVYLQPIFGLRPDYSFPLIGIFKSLIDSVGQEFLVGKNLGRFASSVDAPFYELNLAANMRNMNDTAVSPGKPRIPHYYRVLVYPSGHSSATGDQPVGQGDWLAVYNAFTALDYTGYTDPLPILGQYLDSWLLRSDGTSLHPSICTIPIGVSLMSVPNTLSTNYLGFRSCIDYIKDGVNNVYFQ